jgi:leucyl aminopeptidase
MREIINCKVKTRQVDFDRCTPDVLALGMFSDSKRPDKVTAELDRKLGGAIGQVSKTGDFRGKEGTNAVVYGSGRVGARRILLVGLGDKKEATLDTIRKAAANAAKKSVELKAKTLCLGLHRAFDRRLSLPAMGRAMAEGVFYGSYRYDEFVTKSENGRLGSLRVEVVEPDSEKVGDLRKAVAAGEIIGRAQSYARTLANRPANVINPPKLAAVAREMARRAKGLSCTVFDKKRLAAKGMGGILAVGSGSQSEPRFIVLKYSPAHKPARGLPTIALVGKAITFDSGGISIKPATDMDHMKLDKSGGIAVLATMKAVSELGLPLNVYGLIPSAENLPSGSSYRPGDIVTTYSGKTVEVLNTDAEGRMILCDALAYATRQKCGVIIDVATLTGACMVALGTYMAGLMSNDDELRKRLQKAAGDSGEKVWHMPSGDEYAKEMKSKIADLRNIGTRWGGACTAAAFLRQFVGDAKWAHLDIAGMDIFRKDTEFSAEGSTGFGVRLLTTYLMNLATK